MKLKPEIGVSQKRVLSNIKNLTTILSNEMVLYVKTRRLHWNVSGDSFMELHKLLEEHYTSIEIIIDEVTERISKLGGKGIGNMSGEFLEYGILNERPKNKTQDYMILELLNDHEEAITNLKDVIADMEREYNDFGTIDFLMTLMQTHKAKVWTLRKYLSK